MEEFLQGLSKAAWHVSDGDNFLRFIQKFGALLWGNRLNLFQEFGHLLLVQSGRRRCALRYGYVVGIKLQLIGGFGFAKPGMPVEGEVPALEDKWPKE